MAQKGNTIIVTNVAGDGPRLKIWAIMDKQNLSYVKQIIGVLSNKFNQHYGLPGPQTSVLPNALCCVKYRGSYVRAKICNVQQNGVFVQLIDSGMFDLLPMDLIRILYGNSNEEKLLLSMPPLACEFVLANVVCISGERWESRCVETIQSFIKDKELEVSHYDLHNGRYLVKLVFGDQDIGNMLVNKRMAKMATLDEMYKPQMYSQQPPYKVPTIPQQQELVAKEIATNGYSDTQHVFSSSHMESENWRFNQQAYAYQQNHSQPNPIHRTIIPRKQEVAEEQQPKVLEFRGRILEVGDIYECFVSYVDDGPSKFSVQLMQMKAELMGLMSEIQQHEPDPLREPPLPGSVCLARLKVNKCLCRAVVMATFETEIKIYYVDFGNTESVPYTDIYQLPPKFINPRVLSIRICLAGLKEMNITEEVKTYFNGLVKAKEVELHVCKPEGPFLIQYGEIFFNGKNVKEYLKDRFPDIAKVTYGHLPALTDGTKETVYVSYVASCAKFFVQLEKNMKDIEDMMTAVNEYASTAPPLKELSVGFICIALYDDDKQWYRVKILKIDGDKVNVLYVDYGNEDTVSVDQLRAIRKDLVTQVPCQAIHCVLNGFQSRVPNKLYDNQFENLTSEKRFSMLVKNAQPSCLIVDLFDISTTPAKNILVELNKSAEGSSNESDKNLGHNYQKDNMDLSKTSAAQSSNPFRSNNDDNSRPKSKSWKDDHNEQRHDNRYQRRDDNERFNREGVNKPFNRDGRGNNPFNRDGGGNNPFNRDAGGNNPFNRDGGSERFNRNGGNDRFNRDGGNDRFNRDGGNDRFNRDAGNDRFNRDDGGSDRFNRDGANDRFNRDGGNDRFNRDGGNDRFNRDGANDRFNRNGGNERFNRDGGNDRFNRDGGNDRFNRDGGNDRFNRDGGNDRFNRVGPRDTRNGGGKFTANKRDQSFTSEKNTSDNESTTSSRGSVKRGERGGFQGRKERDNRDNRFSRFNKFGNRDNESDGFRYRRNEDSSGNNFRARSARDDGFDKVREIKEMINFDVGIDFSEPKKYQIPMPSPTIGGTNECELVYLTNPSNFYIHLIPENLKLEELMEGIASIYETGGTILESSKVKPDVACIAQYTEDEKWYRAIIKSVEGTVATVLFIDYGNVEKVNFDKLKEIKEEFTHLTIQAVPCKLFGLNNLRDWSTEEIESFGEATNGKYLQAEFVARDKDVYQVLLREVENGVAKSEIINEPFCQGVDLMNAKEAALGNTEKVSDTSFQKNQLEFASTNSRWNVEQINPGKKETVLVIWFDSPEKFYCQPINKQKEFRPMMEEIQNVYVKRQPVSDALQPGYPVIAVFPQDEALYRAEIVEVKANRKHIIQYVDFGNTAAVDQRNMYPVETRFMVLPKQAIRCSLKNIIPVNGGDSWSNVNSQEIEKYLLDMDECECTYYEEKDGGYLVSLSTNGRDVADYLIEKKLAKSSVANFTPTFDESATFDIKLLHGQTLHAKVSNVESVSKFYLQFSSAEDCHQTISSYMTTKDPKVMPRLSSHEMCLGAGSLVFTDGMWRRAVVVNCSETTSFDVRFIDTGAYHKVSLDCMLALPSQLSVMQNQAIECSLDNVQPSSSLNEKLKNLVENKVVIVHVEKVNSSRLIVQLYDLLGSKIQLTDDAPESKISPVCPMPILSSTHKVNVSCANHSNSLWLQMSSDAEKDDKLNREMTKFYSEDRESIVPEPNKICVVKNQDGTCCRAVIIRKTDRGAFVNFFDYGISKDVPCDNLKVLDPRFYVPHQLAIHVSLNVTLRGTPAEQVDALKPHLLGKEFTATFYNVHKKWLVDLVENGVKLSDTLTSLNLVGRKFKAIVSHMDDPAQFWIQRFEEISTLQELQKELQNAVSGYLAVEQVLEEGELCAAVSSEGTWYRAQVIDADEDITSVCFIDYGKTDIIDNKPGNLKQLPDSMKIKKTCAIKCRLDVIPVDEDWSDRTCNWLKSLLETHNSLEVVLIAESVPMRVDLLIDGKSVIDNLVEEGHALKVHHEQELVEEIVEVELDPRSAFISHIYSPSEFFVQEEKSVSDLEKIQDRFLVADMLPKVNDIMEGLLCVAKFTDNNWYRARVISHSDQVGTKVLFIDYGNSAVVTETRAIPEDVASIPPLSRKCSLQLPNYVSHWPENVVENFCKLAAEGATIFLMDILKEGESTIVKLTLENEDVAEKLAPPPRSIFISHINSPSDFWVQEETALPEIDAIQEKLCEAENYPLVEIKEGLICAAKYADDEQWYRAKVLSQKENEAVVLFTDYGNTALSTEIRALPEDLTSVAPFAKHCSLQLPSYADEWPQDAFNNFCLLSEDGTVAFFLDVIEEKEIAIVNLILGKENIAEKLVPRATIVSKITITCTEQDIPASEIASPVLVFISHLNSPREFWIQEEESASKLEEIGEKLLDLEGFLQVDAPSEGLICAAQFPDDEVWYRAKIVSHNENETTVNFIDYGNPSSVTELRLLPDDLVVLPALAKKCSLKLPFDLLEWPQEACSEFSKLSADGITCFSMDVLEDGETAIVDLYLDGENIAKNLVPSQEKSSIPEKESAVSECAIPEKEEAAAIPEKESSVPECAIPEKKSTVLEVAILEKENTVPEGAIPEKESTVPEEEDVILEKESTVPEQEGAIPEKESTVPEEAGAILEKKITVPVSVFISHLNSPREFWIQEEESTSKLEEIGEKLLDIEGFLRVDAPSEGLICAAQFPDDEVWYRAKIVSHNESETTVNFIDYGNPASVTELRLLPDDLVALPALSKKCSLKLPFNLLEWPQETCSEFSKLFVDGTTCCSMDILEDGETAIVDLYLDGESIAKKLAPSQVIVPEKSSIPEEESAFPESSIPEKEGAIPEKEGAIPEKEGVIPEKGSIVPKDAISEKESIVPEQEGAIAEKEITVPVSVFISHLNSPREFWIQEEESTSKLEEIGEKLLDIEGFLRVDAPSEGLICAAQFPDDEVWYRAKIVSHNESETTVNFIDYGNPASVTELRLLPDDLVALPALSKKCSLKLPFNLLEWPQETCSEFSKLFVDGTTCCSMDILEDGETAIVDLYLDGESIAKKLAPSQVIVPEKSSIPEEESAFPESSIPEKEGAIPEKEGAIPEKEGAIPEKEGVIPEKGSIVPKDAISEKESIVPEQEGAIAEKEITVPVSVFISHLNSPREFWIQEEESTSKLEEIGEKLLDIEGFLRVDAPSEGLICAAQFPDDEVWYRAKIVSHNESETTVNFIDYGNPASVTELRLLPDDLVALPALSKKCSLKLPFNLLEWPQEAYSEFSKLFVDGTTCCSMDILEDGETAIVDLYLDGESIAKKLAPSQVIVPEKSSIPEEESAEIVPEKSSIPEEESAFPESAIPEKGVIPEKESIVPKDAISEKESIVPEDAISEKESTVTEKADEDAILSLDTQQDLPASEITSPVSVFISHLNSPTEFWVQEEDSASKLEEIGEKLLDIEGFLRVDAASEGLICAAQFPDDEVWYRAKIVSHNESETTVNFIDYGNPASVTELRLLPDDLVALPALSKKCSLKLPFNLLEWPQETCSEFSKLSADGTTSFLMDVLEEGDPAIVNLKLDDERVAEKLIASVPQKLAEKETAVIGQENEKSPSGKEVVTDTKVKEEAGKTDSSSIILLWNVISPTEFWGQVGYDSANILGKLSHADEWPLVEEVKEGMVCAAKVKEEWHRVRVQSTDNGDVQVLLIDQGYTPICSEFRQLPSDLASEPPFSRKYSLKLPENLDKWSQAATAAFCKYSKTSFSMEVLEAGEIPVIKLVHHDEEVSDILASLLDDLSSEISGRLPPEGEENLNMTVSHAISPSLFWGQTESVIPELKAMAKRLKDAASLNTVKNFEVGRLCAAKFSKDGNWYRGKILTHSTEGTQVFFVDFGNTTMTNELRVLPHDLVNIGHLSTQYSLYKPAQIDEWSKEACEKFLKLIDGATMFQYKILDLEKKKVQLIYQGTDVVEILTPLCKKTTETDPKADSEDSEKKVKSKPIEVIDLTEDSESDFPLKEKPEETVTEKITDSSLLSQEPVALSGLEKDFSLTLQESNQVDPESTVSFFAADKGQTSPIKGEIMGRMTCEPEDNIEFSYEQTAVPKKLNLDTKVPKNISETVPSSIERRNSIPYEDKIVPGSISRGEELPESDSESSKSEPITKAEPSPSIDPKIPIGERIVAGCISTEETPSEKNVARVVSLHEKGEKDEKDENIPQ